MEVKAVDAELLAAVAPLLAYAEEKLTEQESDATENDAIYKRIRVCFDDMRQPRRILDDFADPPPRDVVSAVLSYVKLLLSRCCAYEMIVDSVEASREGAPWRPPCPCRA
jgi:hypothetical protein